MRVRSLTDIACLLTQTRDIQRKALEEIRADGDEQFKASNCWVQNFMRRNKLSVRRPTSVGQPQPPDCVQKIASFLTFVREATAEISPQDVGNMDEVPVPFDLFYGRTVALKGSDCVKIDTTGHEKAYFTVVLCVTATGEKLPPTLIFKKKTHSERRFPSWRRDQSQPQRLDERECHGGVDKRSLAGALHL